MNLCVFTLFWICHRFLMDVGKFLEGFGGSKPRKSWFFLRKITIFSKSTFPAQLTRGSKINGKIDGFTCSIGTGGTLTGVGIGLKSKNKNIKIACTDSQGSSMYNYFTRGKLEKKGEPSFTEGIGQARITKNLENCSVDMSYYVDDKECLEILYKLIN